MSQSGSGLCSSWRAAAVAIVLSMSGGVVPLLAYDPPPTYSIPGGTFFDKVVDYPHDDDHFKYGSLGGERGYKGQIGFGLPYWIWVAMPELFPEYLPDRKPGQGLKAFGYIYEKGRDPRFQLPIGTSQRRNLGVDRVWINCGVCHTGTVRETPESPPQIVLGMPANRYNQGAWVKFLFAAASDGRFNSDDVLRKIRELEKERRRLITEGKLAGGTYLPPDLGPLDELIYEHVVIPAMKDRLLGLRSRLGFIDFASWGPGRVDTFNAPKALLNFPMDRAPEKEKRGNADLPSVWYQKAREGMQLHWDGNNTSVQERNLSAAFAASMPTTLDKCNLRRVARYLETLAPPPFPAARIDRALAERGKPIYDEHCARCHGAPSPPFRAAGMGERVGTVVPLGKIGTDPARFDSYTPELARSQNLLYAEFPLADSQGCPGDPGARDYPARFTHFRKTDGYASSPLDGIWLRAPYLHNGSVPTLRALLAPSAERPRVFWIGYDVYDYKDVGFITQGPAAEAEGWRYDTAVTANGNRGHEGRVYGTELSADEKDALIEYLKTF
jgi:hypothetical protein